MLLDKVSEVWKFDENFDDLTHDDIPVWVVWQQSSFSSLNQLVSLVSMSKQFFEKKRSTQKIMKATLSRLLSGKFE